MKDNSQLQLHVLCKSEEKSEENSFLCFSKNSQILLWDMILMLVFLIHNVLARFSRLFSCTCYGRFSRF